MMQVVMHVHLIGIAIAIAVGLRMAHNASTQRRRSRCRSQGHAGQLLSSQARWHRALGAFVAPPLLLLTTAVAIVTMGERSCHAWEGWLSYGIATAFLWAAMAIWARLAWRAFRLWQTVQSYAAKTIETQAGPTLGKVLPSPSVFSAQVGLLPSVLVVSEGLFQHLSPEQVDAVLAHEAGHAYYRDTFWFFWLGGLRQLTGWLPYSEALWEELLLLREIRADLWAARRVDALVLAESLLSVVTAPLIDSEALYAGLSCEAARKNWLSERVEALLQEELPASNQYLGEPSKGNPSQRNLSQSDRVASFQLSPRHWLGLVWALTPLLTIPFHH
ncbi:MAG: M56 family metallopeptidase [Cyanobacteria bacterium J06597_16]